MKENNMDLSLLPLDELFSTQEMRDEAKLERIHIIPIAELHPFQNHPFKIRENEEMQRMIESIKQVGTITPALARPTENGYELISGHRRLAACQVLGIDSMPVMVRELNDDEAVIAMVDANLQRETILPSEKAFAYKMKLDAIKHQGKASTQVGQKLLSVEQISKKSDDSREQIRRYIRLTNLIPDILQMVDEGKIAFNPAVEVSYLTEDEQNMLLEIMQFEDCTPSHAQAIRLKRLSQEDKLDGNKITEIMTEAKPNQQEQYKFKKDDIRKYFPSSYTDKQIHNEVFKALELLKRHRERKRDSR